MLLLLLQQPISVIPLDIHFKYSGGINNYNPNESFGGAVSNHEITGANLENLFDYIPQASKIVGATDGTTPGTKDYRVFYIKIAEGSNTSGVNGKLWMSANDSISALSYRLAVGQLNTIVSKPVSENTMPPGLTFSPAPTSQGTGLDLPVVSGGDFVAVAIERSIAATNDTQTFNGPTFTCYWD